MNGRGSARPCRYSGELVRAYSDQLRTPNKPTAFPTLRTGAVNSGEKQQADGFTSPFLGSASGKTLEYQGVPD
jgi:hypothetical protein